MHATWLLALVLVAAPADKPSMAVAGHVRAAANAVSLLQRTAAGSATVRELMARLEASDVIVYVELSSSPQIGAARTKLVTSTPAARFLRIGISTSMTPLDMAALVAHELQHAVEIAERDDVRDDEGMRRLYARIGHQHGVDRYETDAAAQAERRARDELQRIPHP